MFPPDRARPVLGQGSESVLYIMRQFISVPTALAWDKVRERWHLSVIKYVELNHTQVSPDLCRQHPMFVFEGRASVQGA